MAPAHLALAAAQLVFGFFPVLGQYALGPGGIAPLAIGAWRLAGGALILLSLASLRGSFRVPARSDLPRFVAASLLGMTLNQALYLQGLARSTPLNAVLIMCLIPVFTFALAALARQERFDPLRFGGVLLAFAGTLPLLLEDGFHGLGQHGVGNLLMVANGFLYSGYLIVSKPLLRRYQPLNMIAWCYLFTLPFVPFFAWGTPLLPTLGAAWWSLAYIIVFPTVVAYLFNMYGLSRVPASTAATYIYAQPLVTGIASWIAFHETPTRAMLIAAPALFAGIWLVSRPAQVPASR